MPGFVGGGMSGLGVPVDVDGGGPGEDSFGDGDDEPVDPPKKGEDPPKKDEEQGSSFPFIGDGPPDIGPDKDGKRKKKWEEIKKLKEDYPFIVDPSGKGEEPTKRQLLSDKGCCIRTFEYPEKPPVKTISSDSHVSQDGSDRRKVTISFTGRVVFDPDSPCLCKCCQFRQFIIVDQVDLGTPPPPSRRSELRRRKSGYTPDAWLPKESWGRTTGKGGKPDMRGEDCMWLVYVIDTGTWQQRQGTAHQKFGTDPNKHHSAARKKAVASFMRVPLAIGPICYGRKMSAEMKEQLKRIGKKGGLTQTVGDCEVSVTDEPEEEIPINRWFAWRIVFLAIVYDRCNDWAIRDFRLLPITVQGFSGTSDTGTAWIAT